MAREIPWSTEMENDTRAYPTRCTSAFCGQTTCDGCSYKPELDEFKSWKERTAAVCPDKVWSPTIYVATK